MYNRDLFGRYLPLNPRNRKPKEPLTPRAKLLRRRLRRRIKEIESLNEPCKGNDLSAQFPIEENKEIKKDQIYFEFTNVDSLRFDDDIEWQLVTEFILEETARLNLYKANNVTTFLDDKELDKEVEQILRNPLPSPSKRS
jgi:hypothetical protein